MPWTGPEFRRKHNKRLTGPQAAKASRQANAMLRSGVDEGIAIATANKHARDPVKNRKANNSRKWRSTQQT